MRSFSLSLLAVLCTACTGGDGQRKSPGDDSNAPATKDAPMAESRHLIVELRWIQIIDRHANPGPIDEPARKTVDTAYGFDEVFALPDYSVRSLAERPEIRRGEWTLVIPERELATFELTIDAQSPYRLIVFSEGWKVGPDGRVASAVVMRSNWEIENADGYGGGPDQVGLGEVALAVWQASKATAKHAGAFAYFELMEARLLQITADPPADAIRGQADTVAGQRDKQREWSIKVVKLP